MSDIAEAGLTAEEARDRFDEILKRAADDEDRVVVTRGGKPVAAVVPIADLEFLEAIEDHLDAEEYRRAKEEFEQSGEPAIPLEEVVRRLGIKA